MVYISVALGIEAKPLIRYFDLKRDNTIKKFQVFKNEDIVLIITGVGILKSAIATTFLLSQEIINEDDIFLNLGICGARDKRLKIGDIVLCNKIINSELKKNYYPDMIFEHSFEEGSLESFNSPVYSDVEVSGDIVDMEGAGVVEAASYFFQTYQLNVIKIVSDYLENSVDSKNVEKLLEDSLLKVGAWIKKRKTFKVEKKQEFSEVEEKKLKSFISEYKFSVTMANELEDLMYYSKLAGKDIIKILEKYSCLEDKYKKIGKKILEDIKNNVIGVKNER